MWNPSNGALKRPKTLWMPKLKAQFVSLCKILRLNKATSALAIGNVRLNFDKCPRKAQRPGTTATVFARKTMKASRGTAPSFDLGKQRHMSIACTQCQYDAAKLFCCVNQVNIQSPSGMIQFHEHRFCGNRLFDQLASWNWQEASDYDCDILRLALPLFLALNFASEEP